MRILPYALLVLLALPLASASGLARTVEDACEPSEEWEHPPERAFAFLPPTPPSPPPTPEPENLLPKEP